MNKSGRGKWLAISVVILALLLVIAIGYIVFDKYRARVVQKEIGIYQQGMQAAIAYLYQQAGSCKQVPITVENQTINVVAVECLKAG